MAVSGLCLFLTVSCVGLQCVIVAFPCHTHFFTLLKTNGADPDGISSGSSLFAKVHEPQHEISNNVVCETSKGSDKPAHTGSLIRDFGSRLNIL